MATPESSLPSAGSAPPPASSTAAPPPNASAPSQGQPSPDASAQDGGGAVSTESGAQPQHPQSPEAQAQARADAARARLRSLGTQNADAGAQPEAQVEPPDAAAPIEEPVEGQQPAEQPAPAEPLADPDFEDLETFLTEDQLRKRYHVPVKLAPELAARETQRQQMVEGLNKIGGEYGLNFGAEFFPLLWKQDPTEQDAEAAFDALVLPNKGGARKLITKMANHFVGTALYDPDHGPGFASDLIREEWGVQPDGKTPYDLQFVDGLLKAHKSWGIGPDGKPIDVATLNTLIQSLQKNGITIEHAAKLFRGSKLGVVNTEYLDNELADHPEEPERERSKEETDAIARAEAAEAKLRETETTAEQKQAEQKAEHERKVGVYRTQATGWLRQYVLAKVMPAATKANWAAQQGEEVSPAKKSFGKLISTTINHEIQYGATKEAYDGLMTMIDEGEAFDGKGQPTPRFLQAARPLQNSALALHNEYLRDLSPVMKFTAGNSRNAKLVAENGRNGQQPEDLQPPPIAQPRPVGKEESYEEGKTRIRNEYQARVRAAQATPGTLR